jgi:hypothetical protein
MAISVSDTLPNVDENIVNAAKIIGKSKHRQAIFEKVYFGKKQFKAVRDIAKALRITSPRSLNPSRRSTEAVSLRPILD